MRRTLIALLLQTAVVCAAQEADEQWPESNGGFDSTYILDRTDLLTVRLYTSTKLNAIELRDGDLDSRVSYLPNTNGNIGFGVSYRGLTGNISFGVGFRNDDLAELNETRYLDANGNMISRRFAISLFAHNYRGYFIDALDYPGSGTDSAHARIMRDKRLRPELVQDNLGLLVLHILNNRRFSYRAAFNQDTWQRRSSGSLLAGGYAIYQGLRSDSPIVPVEADSLFSPALRFRRMEQVEFGGLIGYAHTFVIGDHVFISLSLAAGLGLVHSEAWYPDGGTDRRQELWTAGLRSQQRISLGYNGASMCAGIGLSNETSTTAPGRESRYGWNVGTVRLFAAYRFGTRIGFVDRIIDRLRRR